MSESSYVKRWKSWIGRKKVFSQDELNELETYLIDKMEMLQESNHLSEKESFQQALDAMGESGLLNEEYTKIRKSPFDQVKWWALVQTVVSVSLIITIIGPYLHQSKGLFIFPDSSIFTHYGFCEIPNAFRLSNHFTLDGKFCFLDHYSDNIVLLNLTKSTVNHRADYDFEFKGTLIPETILKDPTTLCQDEDSTIYILESGDRIYPTSGMKLHMIGDGEKIPFHIMKMNQKKEFKEYSNLHLKIPEISTVEEPEQIKTWGDSLVISFQNCDSSNNNYWCISAILLLNKTSLEKTTLDYKMFPIQQSAFDFNIYDNKLWLLYSDRIDWYSMENNSEPIKEGSIALTDSISDATKLFQHESYQDFILFDRDNNAIHLINKETHQTKVHKATGITNLHVFNENEISGIFSFVKTNDDSSWYPLSLYQLKPSESELNIESKEPSD